MFPLTSNEAYIKSTGERSTLGKMLEITANKSDLASISITGTMNNTGSTIASGTYFYLNGALVKAKTSIANGATLTKNTNYVEVTAGALNELKQAQEELLSTEYTVIAADTWEVAGSFITDKKLLVVAEGRFTNGACYGIAISSSNSSVNTSYMMQESTTGSFKQVVGVIPSGTWYIWVKYSGAGKNIIKAFSLLEINSNLYV